MFWVRTPERMKFEGKDKKFDDCLPAKTPLIISGREANGNSEIAVVEERVADWIFVVFLSVFCGAAMDGLPLEDTCPGSHRPLLYIIRTNPSPHTLQYRISDSKTGIRESFQNFNLRAQRSIFNFFLFPLLYLFSKNVCGELRGDYCVQIAFRSISWFEISNFWFENGNLGVFPQFRLQGAAIDF